MTSYQSILEPTFRDLTDAVSDFRNANHSAAESVLMRFVAHLDEEPLLGFLRSVLPAVDFDAWWQRLEQQRQSTVRSGGPEWPRDRAERIAIQIALCRSIVNKRVNFYDLLFKFYYENNGNVQACAQAFARGLLDSLIRDIRRLTEFRPVQPFLRESMRDLPASGDADLDAMLRESCRKFSDPAPSSRQDAVEKLWDAWERLKSMDDADKSRSTAKLLDSAGAIPEFRDLLDCEGKELTRIGNNFRIRHSEVSKSPITQPEQYDYLFHRLFALIHYLLVRRQSSNGG